MQPLRTAADMQQRSVVDTRLAKQSELSACMQGGGGLFASAIAAATFLTPKPAMCADEDDAMQTGLVRLDQRLGGIEAFLGQPANASAKVAFRPMGAAVSSQESVPATASAAKDTAVTSTKAPEASAVPKRPGWVRPTCI